MINSESASKIAQLLLEIEAVKIQPNDPFKWSSGWNSPVYCDNRKTLSFPEHRTLIKQSFAKAVQSFFPDANCLVGVATAGVALGALVADEMDLPYAYCRPKPKAHGMKNQLEGAIPNGSKIVVVEDLISTGGSSLKVVEYLRKEGYEVVGMGAIFTYGFPLADEQFKKADCPYFTLSNYHHLLSDTNLKDSLTNEQMIHLQQWREAPEKWS